eukprot:518137_1
MSAKKYVYSAALATAGLIFYNTFFKTHETQNSIRNTKYLYISGDRSAVGKSSVCAAIIHSLITNKILKPSEIAYIKPMTQCIKPTNVSRYCLMNKIDCIPIGPIVFKKGYTSEIIDNKHGSKESRLQLIKTEIEKLATNKKLVIIDGVGYVSVGSVTQIDNVEVAKLMNAFTILIVRSGIGDSIDTTNLLLSYYQTPNNIQYFKNKFIGVIYNFKEKNNRHKINDCKKYVSKYFNVNKPNLKLLGWLPPVSKDNVKIPDNVTGCMMNNKPETIDWKSWPELHKTEMQWLSDFAKNFQKNIDLNFIFSMLNI